MAQLRYLPDVVTLTFDGEKCTGCGMCVAVCPRAVLAIENAIAHIVDRDACMECGACARNCPAEAVSVRSGVGCAMAIILQALRGPKACCGGSDETPCCS